MQTGDPNYRGRRAADVVITNLDDDGAAIRVTAAPDLRTTEAAGTAKFTLNDAARKEIKRFVSAGGTLIVDAAGGSVPFAESAESELAAMFGGAPTDLGEILPPTHRAYGPASHRSSPPGSPATA